MRASDELRTTIEQVMSEPTFVKAISAIQASFKQAERLAYTVDLIEQETDKIVQEFV